MNTVAFYDTKPYDREALSEIACVTTANVLQLETGEPFLVGTTLTPSHL